LNFKNNVSRIKALMHILDFLIENKCFCVNLVWIRKKNYLERVKIMVCKINRFRIDLSESDRNRSMQRRALSIFATGHFFKRKSSKSAESRPSQSISSLGLLQVEFWEIIVVIERKLKVLILKKIMIQFNWYLIGCQCINLQMPPI
jgi:hypothetical protein